MICDHQGNDVKSKQRTTFYHKLSVLFNVKRYFVRIPSIGISSQCLPLHVGNSALFVSLLNMKYMFILIVCSKLHMATFIELDMYLMFKKF